MSLHLFDIALREICETKQLLDSLLTSSESFDYPKARLALKSLERKSRELAQVRAAFEQEQRSLPTPPNVISLHALRAPAH